MNGPMRARRTSSAVLALLLTMVVAGLTASSAAAGQPGAAALRCPETESVREILASSVTVRSTEVQMLRVTRTGSGFTADARVRSRGTAIARVRVTTDVCPDGVSHPATATTRLNRRVARTATVRHRTAASRSLATELALHGAQEKASERMRKALIVAASRQARDEAAEVSAYSRPVGPGRASH